MRFAVLASGNGSNLQAIIRACRTGKIGAELHMVLSDKPDAYALVRARRAKVPVVLHVSPKDYPSRYSFDQLCIESLRKEKIELVVLAGYMRILSSAFIQAFPNRILNIHPALLPAFRGGQAVSDALEYGVKVTGVTVHFVDEEIDHGAVVLQATVPITDNDTSETLTQKIHRVEHRLYPKAIDLFVRGKLQVCGRKVTAG